MKLTNKVLNLRKYYTTDSINIYTETDFIGLCGYAKFYNLSILDVSMEEVKQTCAYKLNNNMSIWTEFGKDQKVDGNINNYALSLEESILFQEDKDTKDNNIKTDSENIQTKTNKCEKTEEYITMYKVCDKIVENYDYYSQKIKEDIVKIKYYSKDSINIYTEYDFIAMCGFGIFLETVKNKNAYKLHNNIDLFYNYGLEQNIPIGNYEYKIDKLLERTDFIDEILQSPIFLKTIKTKLNFYLKDENEVNKLNKLVYNNLTTKKYKIILFRYELEKMTDIEIKKNYNIFSQYILPNRTNIPNLVRNIYDELINNNENIENIVHYINIVLLTKTFTREKCIELGIPVSLCYENIQYQNCEDLYNTFYNRRDNSIIYWICELFNYNRNNITIKEPNSLYFIFHNVKLLDNTLKNIFCNIFCDNISNYINEKYINNYYQSNLLRDITKTANNITKNINRWVNMFEKKRFVDTKYILTKQTSYIENKIKKYYNLLGSERNYNNNNRTHYNFILNKYCKVSNNKWEEIVHKIKLKNILLCIERKYDKLISIFKQNKKRKQHRISSQRRIKQQYFNIFLEKNPILHDYMIELTKPKLINSGKKMEKLYELNICTDGILVNFIKYYNRNYTIEWNNIVEDNIINQYNDEDISILQSSNIYLSTGKLLDFHNNNNIYNNNNNSYDIIICNMIVSRTYTIPRYSFHNEIKQINTVIRQLNVNGRCCLIVDSSLLRVTENVCVKFREDLVNNYSIDKIISLDNYTEKQNSPYTIILFSKTINDKNDKNDNNIEFSDLIKLNNNKICETNIFYRAQNTFNHPYKLHND